MCKSGGKIRKDIGNSGCTWIIGTSPTHTAPSRFHPQEHGLKEVSESFHIAAC